MITRLYKLEFYFTIKNSWFYSLLYSLFCDLPVQNFLFDVLKITVEVQLNRKHDVMNVQVYALSDLLLGLISIS